MERDPFVLLEQIGQGDQAVGGVEREDYDQAENDERHGRQGEHGPGFDRHARVVAGGEANAAPRGVPEQQQLAAAVPLPACHRT